MAMLTPIVESFVCVTNAYEAMGSLQADSSRQKQRSIHYYDKRRNHTAGEFGL